MQALTIEDIKELGTILCEAFAYVRDLKNTHALARYVKNFQIPSILSESLAFRLLEKGELLPELKGSVFQMDEKGGDIITLRNGNRISIEVKATGPRGFQRLSQRDVDADFLIWIHFDGVFELESDDPITIYIIRDPKKFYRAREEVFVHQVQKKVGDTLEKTSIFLQDL